MSMVDQHTRQQVSDLVNSCGGYWGLRGIAEARRKEMELELEQHLEQALRDGKSLAAVVGPDALAFAESWARETPRRTPRGGVAILNFLLFDWLAYVLLFLLFIALFEHIILRVPTFPFTLTHLVTVILIGVSLLFQAASGFLSPRLRSREMRLGVAFAVYAGISLLVLLLLSLVQVPLRLVLFSWDWPVTLALLPGAGLLFGLKAWFARKNRQRHLR